MSQLEFQSFENKVETNGLCNENIYEWNNENYNKISHDLKSKHYILNALQDIYKYICIMLFTKEVNRGANRSFCPSRH